MLFSVHTCIVTLLIVFMLIQVPEVQFISSAFIQALTTVATVTFYCCGVGKMARKVEKRM